MMQRMLAILWALLYAAALPRTAYADAPPQEPGAIRIHVKGTAQITASALTDSRGVVLRGELTDDAMSPIAGGAISIKAFAPEDPGTPLALPEPSACEVGARGQQRDRAVSGNEYVVDTDERGSFCVRSNSALPSAIFHLHFHGTKLHDPVEAKVTLDASEARTARARLRFEPAIEEIDLDRESVPVSASLRVDRSEALPDIPAKREGMLVVLEDERGTRIADAWTGGDGRARFDVKTASLAGPGQGELRLRFDGAPGLAKATASLPVVRRAEARLALAAPPSSSDPEDGVPIDVEVTSSRGPVSEGVVEALRGVDSVGAAKVDDGRALVVASFAVDHANRVPLTLRYVPSAPWWRAGPDLRVDVAIEGPGLLRQILLAVVVVVVTAWVIAGWRRAPKPRAPKDVEAPAAAPSGRAGVQVVAASADQSGWRGIVTDAHEGTPVTGANLSIVVPSFEGDGVVLRAVTDDRGAFTLEGAPAVNGARLIVESATHSTYEQALPPPSVLGVTLVTRRRAMLDRLVRWARRQGAPFDGPPEPTPGHVRRVAARANVTEVEAWAHQLEQIAFGPDTVDEHLEQQIRATEPKGGR